MLNVPWPITVYPGAARWLAGVLGVGIRTAEALLGGRARLTEAHARRVADFLEAQIAKEQAVLAELRAHVEAAEKRRALNPHPGYQAGIAKWRRQQALAKAGGEDVSSDKSDSRARAG